MPIVPPYPTKPTTPPRVVQSSGTVRLTNIGAVRFRDGALVIEPRASADVDLEARNWRVVVVDGSPHSHLDVSPDASRPHVLMTITA